MEYGIRRIYTFATVTHQCYETYFVTTNYITKEYFVTDVYISCSSVAINICELEDLCKEWLKSREYMLSVFHHLDTVGVTLHLNEEKVYSTPVITVYTKEEAIFKACE